MTSLAGTIDGLWRFAVKSMRGERVDRAELTECGLLGDRAFAITDVETGKVASAKSVRLFPDLLRCQARFVEPPRLDRDLPQVRITLGNGTTVTSDSARVDRDLSAYFKRDVRLSRSAPPDFTIDQFHPDLEDIDPAGHRNTVVEQKLGSAFFEEAGLPSPVPVGAFFDLFPLSVLTTSTLRRLNELQPQTRFDERRFRMNVIVRTDGVGFAENDWVGRDVALGGAARITVALPDPRCVMTTLPQDDLPNDTNVLRTLTRYNKLPIAGSGDSPCAGVYAVVASAGALRAGDNVSVG